MNEIICPAPAFVVLTSLIGVVFIALAGKRPNVREFFTFVTAFVKFGLVLSILPKVLNGNVIVYKVAEVFPDMPGMSIQFRADALSMFLALTASGLWIVNSLYSIGYMRAHGEPHQTRYFSAFAIALAATMGVAFSGSLFTLFLFYELLTISTYPLVAHNETDVARAGAGRYVVILMGASIAFFLAAFLMTWHAAPGHDLTFKVGGLLAGTTASRAYIAATFFLFVFGVAKAAIMPMHPWLPAAMVAPTPVSALLHAVAVVKVGVFSVVKILLYVFGVDLLADLGLGQVLTWFAGYTIIVASVIALKQDNLKRRLAYSTVSQLSYIILGVALLSPGAIGASLLHILFHAFGKITLFFAAGSIYIAAHKTEISQLDGIGRRMPWTMGAFAIGSLSMIGLPPAAGFISKWYLLMGALEQRELVAVGVIIVSSLLNAAYFLPIAYRAFFKEEHHGEHHHEHGESPLPMVAALTVTAAGTLILFFCSTVPEKLARMVVEAVT